MGSSMLGAYILHDASMDESTPNMYCVLKNQDCMMLSNQCLCKTLKQNLTNLYRIYTKTDDGPHCQSWACSSSLL